jgi:O-antigen/teichoic acid export membrane protein
MPAVPPVERNACARLVGMSTAFATSNAARTAISFATSLVVARGLGIDDFGRWTLCMAWAAVLTVTFDLGFGVLLTRDAARAIDSGPEHSRGPWPEHRREPWPERRRGPAPAVGAALIVRLGVLAPAAIALAVMPQWFVSDAETATGLRLAPLVAAAGVAYGSLAPVFRASPTALVASLSIETVGALGQWGAAWWLLQGGQGIAALLVMSAVVQAVQFTLALAVWRFVGGPGPLITWPSRAVLTQSAREALPFAAAGLIANAQLRIAPVLLGLLASPAAVAAFGVAARIGNLARMLPQAAFAGALPVLSQEARDGSDRLRVRFDRMLAAFSMVTALAIAGFAQPIIASTYGSEFGDAVMPLVWIAIGLIPTLMNSGRKVQLYASGREAVAVRWSAAALAVQTVAAALLIPVWGAAGAAIGLAFGEAVVWGPLNKVLQGGDAAVPDVHVREAGARVS